MITKDGKNTENLKKKIQTYEEWCEEKKRYEGWQVIPIEIQP